MMLKKTIHIFFLILSWGLCSQTFIDNNFTYTITSTVDPYTIEVSDYDVDLGGIDVIIPNAVEYNNISYAVTSIGEYAFYNNPLKSVTSSSLDPASIDNSIRNRGSIDLTIPTGAESNYATNGWTGFKSITTSESLSIESYELSKYFKVYVDADNDKLYVENEKHRMKNICIYNSNGIVVKTIHVNNTSSIIDISTFNKGVYIIKIQLKNRVFAKKLLIL